MLDPRQLVSRLDPDQGTIDGQPLVRRHLSDLRGCFHDAAAYEARLRQKNPLVYSVAAFAGGEGDGDLHYGIGMIMPGRIGDEYWLTKGHLHAWRPAAELYFGLRGQGMMLLEDEADGTSRLLPLEPDQVVYVPGRTAHRTMNTGSEPLIYVGVYPAKAGHDYGVIAERNFRAIVVEREGRPALLDRHTGAALS